MEDLGTLEVALVEAGRQLSSAVGVLVAGRGLPSTGSVTLEPEALAIRVAVADAELVLELPFDPVGPTFDQALRVRRRAGTPEELDLARIEELLLADPALARVPRTPPSRLVRVATLAPYAAFLLIATADGTVDEGEIEAFEGSLAVTRDPALGELLAACPVDPVQAIQLLSADPPLAIRALAAAGTLFSRRSDGAAARATLLDIVRAIASEGGISSAEQVAIDLVTQALEAGEGQALEGLDPFGPAADGTFSRAMPVAAFAPFAAYLAVARRRAEAGALERFVDRIAAAGDPLLVAMVGASDLPPDERIAALREDPELARRALLAAGAVFARHPLGHRARKAFLDLLRANPEGPVDELEQRLIARVVRGLGGEITGTQGHRLRVATIGGVALAAVVGAWQVASVAFGLTLWFVPVACVLQLLVLGPMLAATSALGGRYSEQVMLGTVTSVLGGVLIAMSSVLVTTGLFPATLEAAAFGAVTQAVAGLVGTVLTGVVISAVVGRFLRARD